MYVLPVDFFADEEPALVFEVFVPRDGFVFVDVGLFSPELKVLVGVVLPFTYSHVPLLFKITLLPSVVVAYWFCAYNETVNIDAIIIDINVFIVC